MADPGAVANAVSEPDPAASGAGRLVLRNALFLTIAQAVIIPVSLVMSAAQGRFLGAAALGHMYLGTTLNSFGFLAVDWGQSGGLPALVATDRSRAGRLLGTSLVWRAIAAAVVAAALNLLCRFLGYGPDVQVVVALLSACYTLDTLTNACQHTMIGFERTDAAALRQGLGKLSELAIVLPILACGCGLRAALVGYLAGCAIINAHTWRAVSRAGIGRLSVDYQALVLLLKRGTPFVFIGIAMVLQVNVDTVFLSKLGSPDAVGWHAAARRLTGVLVFPASALVGALYPTLCRLHATDQGAFLKTVSASVRGTCILVIPVALGCALFPEIGTTAFGRAAFSPAEDNLRVLSLHLFLVYFTMPLGICLTAAGRQRAWAAAQAACVGVSVVLDPILVPLFQRRMGNGGLGVCVAVVVSEIVVLVFGVVLVPRGIFDRQFWRSLLLALVSGLAMVIVARGLRSVSSFLAAPAALGAYVGALWITGGLDRSHVGAIRDMVKRRVSR